MASIEHFPTETYNGMNVHKGSFGDIEPRHVECPQRVISGRSAGSRRVSACSHIRTSEHCAGIVVECPLCYHRRQLGGAIWGISG